MRRHRDAFYPRRNPEAGALEDRRRFLESATISRGLPSLFYASLRDPEVFKTVVGRSLDAAEWEVVTLKGYRLAAATAGTGYPGIFPAPADERLECLLVHDLSRYEKTMIAWYEWDEYTLEKLPLADGRTVQSFVPDLEAIRREYGEFDIKPWSFSRWQADHRERAVCNARAWMAQRPDDSALLDARCFVTEDLPTHRRATG